MQITNQSTKELEHEESAAIREACAKLERAFGRKIWKAFLNPDKENAGIVFRICFVFDSKGRAP